MMIVSIMLIMISIFISMIIQLMLLLLILLLGILIIIRLTITILITIMIAINIINMIICIISINDMLRRVQCKASDRGGRGLPVRSPPPRPPPYLLGSDKGIFTIGVR